MSTTRNQKPPLALQFQQRLSIGLVGDMGATAAIRCSAVIAENRTDRKGSLYLRLIGPSGRVRAFWAAPGRERNRSRKTEARHA